MPVIIAVSIIFRAVIFAACCRCFMSPLTRPPRHTMLLFLRATDKPLMLPMPLDTLLMPRDAYAATPMLLLMLAAAYATLMLPCRYA